VLIKHINTYTLVLKYSGTACPEHDTDYDIDNVVLVVCAETRTPAENRLLPFTVHTECWTRSSIAIHFINRYHLDLNIVDRQKASMKGCVRLYAFDVSPPPWEVAHSPLGQTGLYSSSSVVFKPHVLHKRHTTSTISVGNQLLYGQLVLYGQADTLP
jgi:hypothetical protein